MRARTIIRSLAGAGLVSGIDLGTSGLGIETSEHILVYVRFALCPRNFEIGRILHLRSEIRNLRLDRLPADYCQSNLKFWISDLRCRIRPISKFSLVLLLRRGSHDGTDHAI